ncbi:E3 ubiquitin-protein ligase RNFT1 [Scleropages formosus]|uniref:E3 ubiquitin-protein ligase RNFT1 n=1 Tax=Scleropages formosus TaxID=113540 RepID=A0A8C9RMP9_SCLFO|nr:E3 ubiquitin-protein ligase RNFT1 [Scleropages formosus]
MKLRAQHDRRDTKSRKLPKLRESPTVMQTNSNELNARAGNGFSLTLQAEALTRTPAATEGSASSETRDVHVPIDSASGDASGRTASRRQRVGSAHSHSHTHAPYLHSHGELASDPGDSDSESAERNTSLSELRYLFRWVQKSLPFIVILCAKLVVQHALGLAVGVGLFTTFLYANKSIQNQVFLQDRRSKLQSLWVLLFLTCSALLLYYTFHTETLYYCLILVSPSAESLGFWEVLWTVGVTNFILKFIFMGLKCLILSLPVRLIACKSRGRWYMVIEETGQVYQTIAPVPVWFRYLVTYQEVDGSIGLTLGILLALVYLILKLLRLYGHWGSMKKTGRVFLSSQHNGAAATKNECGEAGDVCPICQAAFRDPRVLLCQHIFCDECISLWFNREKTCPLCRTVITDKVHRWKDGATSPHLQVY